MATEKLEEGVVCNFENRKALFEEVKEAEGPRCNSSIRNPLNESSPMSGVISSPQVNRENSFSDFDEQAGDGWISSDASLAMEQFPREGGSLQIVGSNSPMEVEPLFPVNSPGVPPQLTLPICKAGGLKRKMISRALKGMNFDYAGVSGDFPWQSNQRAFFPNGVGVLGSYPGQFTHGSSEFHLGGAGKVDRGPISWEMGHPSSGRFEGYHGDLLKSMVDFGKEVGFHCSIGESVKLAHEG